MVIQAGLMRNRFPRVFWISWKLEGFGTVKRGCEPDLSILLRMNLEHGVFREVNITCEGERTPFSVAFDAAVAFALCFPVIGAISLSAQLLDITFI